MAPSGRARACGHGACALPWCCWQSSPSGLSRWVRLAPTRASPSRDLVWPSCGCAFAFCDRGPPACEPGQRDGCAQLVGTLLDRVDASCELSMTDPRLTAASAWLRRFGAFGIGVLCGRRDPAVSRVCRQPGVPSRRWPRLPNHRGMRHALRQGRVARVRPAGAVPRAPRPAQPAAGSCRANASGSLYRIPHVVTQSVQLRSPLYGPSISHAPGSSPMHLHWNSPL